MILNEDNIVILNENNAVIYNEDNIAILNGNIMILFEVEYQDSIVGTSLGTIL